MGMRYRLCVVQVKDLQILIEGRIGRQLFKDRNMNIVSSRPNSTSQNASCYDKHPKLKSRSSLMKLTQMRCITPFIKRSQVRRFQPIACS